MDRLFLSYTYRSHPAHEADLERLRRCVVKAIEAMGLLIVDGVDVGGRPLDEALRSRIDGSDALVALVTPQADDGGHEENPAFVLSEFQFAEGRQKPTMRVIHHSLVARGLGAGNEYTPFRPGSELDVVLKLMNSIAVWKREVGRIAQVRIEPEELAVQYDEARGDRCEYQVISAQGEYRDFQRARLRLEPGAAYALLPKVRDGERVRLRVKQANTTWNSRFAIDPFVGGVRLETST